MKKNLVALVIGHSEKSKGAYNKALDVHEYDLNKQEALKVYDILEKQGIDCILIHRKTYSKLPQDINKHNPNVIISFHHNAFSQKSTGTETLYYHKSKNGKRLAEIMQAKAVKALGYKDRGVKPKDSEDRGGYLLRYTNATCVILEPCFISNDNELKDFIKNQDKYVLEIANGIKEYINT